jgi:hypothetical protein
MALRSTVNAKSRDSPAAPECGNSTIVALR